MEGLRLPVPGLAGELLLGPLLTTGLLDAEGT